VSSYETYIAIVVLMAAWKQNYIIPSVTQPLTSHYRAKREKDTKIVWCLQPEFHHDTISRNTSWLSVSNPRRE
jgi:hypothetical protein